MVILHGGSSSTCPPPPSAPGQHVVHLHVNPGETVSLQMGGQVQVIQGTPFFFFFGWVFFQIEKISPVRIVACFIRVPVPLSTSVCRVVIVRQTTTTCLCVLSLTHMEAGRGGK
jgi:hypothetical protein